MKTFQIYILIVALSFFSFAFAKAETTTKRKPINYTIILDLSDRVLNEKQLDYDIAQIELVFQKFRKKARQNLIITSKDRFVVKIIPQNGSSLDHNYFENLLQLRLDQIHIKDKNSRMEKLGSILKETLNKLKDSAILGKRKSDYAGVDLWSFLNTNKEQIARPAYDNTIVIMTDGYLDFEDNSHVVKRENQFTGTGFIKTLNSNTWKKDAEDKKMGLLPILIHHKATWIITGLKSKQPKDLFQITKLKYFWTKWITESAKASPQFINYSTESQILSELNSITK
jgi:hypothetical protein